eukprot:COSAG01_NODE_1228_length_11129_cov_184.387851_7_plen_67_part_00
MTSIVYRKDRRINTNFMTVNLQVNTRNKPCMTLPVLTILLQTSVRKLAGGRQGLLAEQVWPLKSVF